MPDQTLFLELSALSPFLCKAKSHSEPKQTVGEIDSDRIIDKNLTLRNLLKPHFHPLPEPTGRLR